MDITLERILSLIPKKADGKYVHGAKKEFCEKIGAPDTIVSIWEKGKIKSYRNYLYAIATEYNVSVEWLRGETDKKNPSTAPVNDEGDIMGQIAAELHGLSKAQQLQVSDYVKFLKSQIGSE